jgi:cobaltochelatase CobN
MVDDATWADEWVRRRLRNRIYLTLTGCLGTCFVGNSAILVVGGRTTRFKELNRAELVREVFDFVEDALEGRVRPSPDAFRARHVIPGANALDAVPGPRDNR